MRDVWILCVLGPADRGEVQSSSSSPSCFLKSIVKKIKAHARGHLEIKINPVDTGILRVNLLCIVTPSSYTSVISASDKHNFESNVDAHRSTLAHVRREICACGVPPAS